MYFSTANQFSFQKRIFTLVVNSKQLLMTSFSFSQCLRQFLASNTLSVFLPVLSASRQSCTLKGAANANSNNILNKKFSSQQPIYKFFFLCVLKQSFAEDHTYQKAFHLHIHFHANNTLIFERKVLHKDSIRNRGKRQLGNCRFLWLCLYRKTLLNANS